jgi:hypothetical protein
MLDKKAKKMFEEVVFLVEMENTFKKPIKKIMFTEHCDENDLKGIDGWIEFNDDKISFSLRSRKLSPYYAPKDVTWTYTWRRVALFTGTNKNSFLVGSRRRRQNLNQKMYHRKFSRNVQTKRFF